MSGVKLVVKHAFGINTHIKNNLIFCEDHMLAYVCGHQVVLFNTETKDQTFISLTALPGFQSQGVTAISCANRRRLVAVAEKADPVAVVSFYDTHSLRKKKVLTYNELGSKEIRCIAFSDDNRLCLTLGAGPEWNLVLWNVEKSAKVLSVTKLSTSDDNPFYAASFCPWDPTIVVVIGKSAIKAFRIGDGQFRIIVISFRRENANFISHCWLDEDEKLLLGTESGEILLFENMEYRTTVYPIGGEAVEDIRPVICMVPTSRGFVMGTTLGEKFLDYYCLSSAYLLLLTPYLIITTIYPILLLRKLNHIISTFPLTINLSSIYLLFITPYLIITTYHLSSYYYYPLLNFNTYLIPNYYLNLSYGLKI